VIVWKGPTSVPTSLGVQENDVAYMLMSHKVIQQIAALDMYGD